MILLDNHPGDRGGRGAGCAARCRAKAASTEAAAVYRNEAGGRCPSGAVDACHGTGASKTSEIPELRSSTPHTKNGIRENILKRQPMSNPTVYSASGDTSRKMSCHASCVRALCIAPTHTLQRDIPVQQRIQQSKTQKTLFQRYCAVFVGEIQQPHPSDRFRVLARLFSNFGRQTLPLPNIGNFFSLTSRILRSAC